MGPTAILDAVVFHFENLTLCLLSKMEKRVGKYFGLQGTK
jgi:hypothetical protein